MDPRTEQAQRAGHHREAGDLAPAAAAGQSPARLLVPVLIIVVVAALDLTVIAPILPAVLVDLRVNTAEADRYVWIVSGYLLAYTLTIPLMGRLSDIVGRRATFLSALGVFLAGSAACAAADTLPAIVAARVVQGFGGGAMVPVAMAVVGDLLPPARRAGALGIVAAADTLGWVLGPLWGAAIEQLTGDWRWIFLLNLPIGLAAGAVLVLRWHDAPLGGRQRMALDLPGALLLAIGLLGLSLGLSVGAEPMPGGGSRALGAAPNPLAAYRLPLVVVGVVALALLVVVERRARDPLIPLGIFRERLFAAANGTNFLIGAALMVAMVNVPLLTALLVEEARVSIVSAELLGAFSLAMGVGALVGGRVAERFGYAGVTLAGLLIAAAGFWRMSGWSNTLEMTRMGLDLAVTGVGVGLVIAPIAAAAINAARRSDLGIASGLVIVMRLLGMTLGISALTAWGVSRLNEALTNLPPVVQQPGESLADYLARQQEVAVQQAIPATIDVIRDTFGAAALICLLAILPTLFLSRHGRRERE